MTIDPPIRVLNVVGSMERGGVETWLMNVLRTADPARYQFDFLVHSEDSAEFEQEIGALKGRIYRSQDASNPIRYARRILSLLLTEPRYQVVHVHMHHFSGVVLALSFLAGIKVRMVTSYSDTRQREVKARFVRRQYLRCMRFLINHFATCKLAVSEGSAEVLYGHPGSARIIQMGVDYAPFASKVDAAEVRSALGLRTGALVVGHVGRFVEPKNHRFVIEIARALKGSGRNVQFLLVGDGPLKAWAKGQVEELGLQETVVFAGARGDVPDLMIGAMDVLILPSIWEGFPIVAIEAQFARLPCLLSAEISREVSFVPGRTKFLEIGAPDPWVQELLELQSRVLNEVPDWQVIRESPYHIENAVASLLDIYDSELRNPTDDSHGALLREHL